MKLFYYSVWWRYSSDNFEYGIIQAESEEQAKETVDKARPGNIGVSVGEIHWDENSMFESYSR